MPGPASTTDSPYQLIKRRLAWLMVAVVVSLAYFSFSNLQQSLIARERAAQVRVWTGSTVEVSGALHQLQRERGLTSGFLASGGANFHSALQSQRSNTDATLDHALRILAQQGIELADWSLDPQIIKQAMAETRVEVSAQHLSRDVAVDRYNQIIERLFALMLSRADSAAGLLRPQLAFIAFLQAKEMAGQERALLTAILSSGDFGHFSRVANFHRIRAIESVRIDQFLQLTEPEARAGYQAIEMLSFSAEAESIRRRVVAAGHSGLQPEVRLPNAERWFEVATQRIDAMKSLEDMLSLTIRREAAQQEERANQALWSNGLTVLVSFLIAALLLWQARRGSDFTESSLRLAGKVFSNSVEAIVIADPDSNILEINQAFARITGYSRDEVVGRHIRLLKSGRHDQPFYAAMWKRIERDGSWEGEIWNRRKNGDIYPALLSIVAVRDMRGELTNYIAMTVELSQHKKTEALLEQLRTFDALTGLLSRDAWLSAMDRATANARGTSRRFAVLEIGLDRFKMINDSLSHAVGDQVLVEAAERVRSQLQRHDTAARPSGDRFSILLEDIESAQNAGIICEKLLAAFLLPFNIDGHALHVSASIGVAIYPGDGESPGVLQSNAETAMYRAKEDGRATYHFYSADMNLEGVRLLALETLLRQALAKSEFSLVYQPQVNVADGYLVGVEALLRWNNPELGSVSPIQFIPMAEETGLIVPIGDWVLHTACIQARHWLDAYGVTIPVAVNLAARQFRKQDLLARIQETLDATGLPSSALELEITEGSLISDPAGAVDVLRGLRAMGVRTAIDDFGTGYSSLAYLKTFPLDRLKIDRAFVRDLPDNISDMAIARAVVALGRNLNMEVLAEGVETKAQSDFLAEIGCHVIQGYYYGKPMTPEQLQEKIEDGQLRLDKRR
jgi:diguanylate cyclase (GGDEF)-like protein/PAS domain S-box-containing protein